MERKVFAEWTSLCLPNDGLIRTAVASKVWLFSWALLSPRWTWNKRQIFLIPEHRLHSTSLSHFFLVPFILPLTLCRCSNLKVVACVPNHKFNLSEFFLPNFYELRFQIAFLSVFPSENIIKRKSFGYERCLPCSVPLQLTQFCEPFIVFSVVGILLDSFKYGLPHSLCRLFLSAIFMAALFVLRFTIVRFCQSWSFRRDLPLEPLHHEQLN